MPFNLRSYVLFSHLDDRQLQITESMAREVKLRDGQLFFQAGDPATRFFLVLEGQIKLSKLSLKGSEKVIEIIPAGETFAEALMFGEQPAYPVNATAIGSTRLLSFDSASYLEVLRGSNETCFRLMADMSQRLKHLISEIELLSLQNAAFRLANFLWKRWEKLDPADGCIELQAPKGVIASRLSVTPETFSRTLHDFSEQGLIRVDGNRVEILNPEGLRAIADPLDLGD
ncbi:MAG: Crp/Fnr family transcriptional regulator [Candidatus Thiodiazotropha sp. (ex Monitilora ramsayi)]|nr:Crp/Fnr family transcriptional regulator [Candidatus Thiodiazotropha sp. (ex Monitilora ramsayi)]